MENRYYNDCYVILDKSRQKKYIELITNSLDIHMSKWKKRLLKDGYPIYRSPIYNDSQFCVEFRAYSICFCYIMHKKPIINDITVELITDKIKGKLKDLIEKLQSDVYSEELQSIELKIGKNDRKDKLMSLEINNLNEIINDTYQDWIENENDITAKLIAKIIYSYRTKVDFYDLWVNKFKNVKMVNDKLKKLEN